MPLGSVRSCPFAFGKDADWGDRWEEKEVCVGDAMVVERPMDSVSVSGAEGGGGRFERREVVLEGRMEARQRKHSPVP